MIHNASIMHQIKTLMSKTTKGRFYALFNLRYLFVRVLLHILLNLGINLPHVASETFHCGKHLTEVDTNQVNLTAQQHFVFIQETQTYHSASLVWKNLKLRWSLEGLSHVWKAADIILKRNYFKAEPKGNPNANEAYNSPPAGSTHWVVLGNSNNCKKS